MKRVELGGLDVLLAGGSDREGGGEGPLVVLLHGFGAGGDDLASLWRVLDAPAGTRWAFPAAPLVLEGTGGAGRAWWMIDLARHVEAIDRGDLATYEREVPAGMREANGRVVAMLDAMDAELHPSSVLLGGFSQGAMLACDVALRTPRPLAGAALLSGTLVARDDWGALAPRRQGLPVFGSHGTGDPLLPFVQAEKLHKLLGDAGAAVTWFPFRGGHEIPPAAVVALGKWMRTTLG